jgi:hypothetical protein
MKKLMTLTLVGMLLSLVVSSCGSSRGAHCDAYGKVETTQTTDVASK